MVLQLTVNPEAVASSLHSFHTHVCIASITFQCMFGNCQTLLDSVTYRNVDTPLELYIMLLNLLGFSHFTIIYR